MMIAEDCILKAPLNALTLKAPLNALTISCSSMTLILIFHILLRNFYSFYAVYRFEGKKLSCKLCRRSSFQNFLEGAATNSLHPTIRANACFAAHRRPFPQRYIWPDVKKLPCVLYRRSNSSTNPPKAATNFLPPTVRAEACFAAHRRPLPQRSIWPQVKELDILEKIEKMTNPLKDEGEWLTYLDLVEEGSKLVLKEMGEQGKCGTECKTIQSAAEAIIETADTDIAEKLWQVGTSSATVDRLNKNNNNNNNNNIIIIIIIIIIIADCLRI
jgi:hypothetical protein